MDHFVGLWWFDAQNLAEAFLGDVLLDLRGGTLGTVLYWNLHAQVERMKARRESKEN